MKIYKGVLQVFASGRDTALEARPYVAERLLPGEHLFGFGLIEIGDREIPNVKVSSRIESALKDAQGKDITLLVITRMGTTTRRVLAMKSDGKVTKDRVVIRAVFATASACALVGTFFLWTPIGKRGIAVSALFAISTGTAIRTAIALYRFS